MTDVEWLLDCTPREVQLEALRRSYYGYSVYNTRWDEPNYVKFRDGPARGWGHIMEMRLGKTPTSLNEMELLAQNQGVTRGVVLSPNTYKHDWVKEARKYGVLRPFFPFETSNRQEAHDFVDEHNDFYVVMNYEALQHDGGRDMFNRIMGMDGVALYIDESIKIKNPQSTTTKSVLASAKEAEFVRILTGKPMTQGPQDLWSQMRSIGAFNGKNFYSFRNRYCKMGGFKNKKIVGAKNEEELKETIDKWAFVAKRKDWGSITVPEYVVESPLLSEKQQEYYSEMDKDFLVFLENDEVVTVDQVISKMLKLQQISSGFIYDEYGEPHQICAPKDLPKMQRLIEIMEETSSKVVVCFHYNHTGDALAEALSSYNPAFIRNKNWMKKNNKNLMDEKEKFNTNPECRVMLANIDAVKYGHYLAGNPNDRCTTMVFFENTYSLDSRAQTEMRVTANEQDWVNVYFDFASTKVEKNAIQALVNKENLVEAVLGAYR